MVWRAYDQSLQRPVACKVLSGSIGHDAVIQKRFQREAHHIASLSHQNIVMVYDAGTEGDFAYIVMEYVEGASLGQVLASARVLPANVTAALAVDVLAALGHAHERGIVHRDVKPANLLLKSGGGAKVADFGISKSFAEMTQLTAEGAFVGTSRYASPEQLSGSELEPSSDVYSLGCVLFQCLTGEPPYRDDLAEHRVLRQRFADPPSLVEFPPDTPHELAQGILRSMAKDPSDRFGSAAEMRESFVPYASHDALHQLVFRRDAAPDRDPTEQTESDVTPALPGRARSATSSLFKGHRMAPTTVAESKWTPGKRIMAIAVAFLLVAVTAGIVVATSGGKRKAAPTSILASGGFLQPGHSVDSPNGRFSLVMQLDGNLVEYAMPKKIVQWQSGSSGNFNAYVVMQADGNLVVYPPGKTAPVPGQPTSALWDSGTYGHAGASAALLNSGEFVVRAHDTNVVLWQAPPHDVQSSTSG